MYVFYLLYIKAVAAERLLASPPRRPRSSRNYLTGLIEHNRVGDRLASPETRPKMMAMGMIKIRRKTVLIRPSFSG